MEEKMKIDKDWIAIGLYIIGLTIAYAI